MSEDTPDSQIPGNSPGDDKSEENEQEDDGLIRGQVRYNQLSARVPESVAAGVFSTGAIVLMGNSEFAIDFVLRMQRPHQVVARVVVPHAVLGQMITAMQQNVDKFEERFGKIPELPKPPKPEPGAPKPSIEDVYDDLKLPDERLSGDYANAVMISHSASEFCFDFIANFFPRSAVSRRVYVSAPQVTRMLDAFKNTFTEFQKRVAANRQQALNQLREKKQQQDNLTLSGDDLKNPYYNQPPEDETGTSDNVDTAGDGNDPDSGDSDKN